MHTLRQWKRATREDDFTTVATPPRRLPGSAEWIGDTMGEPTLSEKKGDSNGCLGESKS